jgi:hypothetical protein
MFGISILYIFVVISTLLTVVAVWCFFRYGTCMPRRRIEGFKSTQDKLDHATKQVDNALLNVMSQVKRVNTMLMDTSMWKERIEMATMSPMDLARKYITSQQRKPLR